MMYLIDANVLIEADKSYYPLDRVPQYWDWILKQAEKNIIKMPLEIHNEITKVEDNLVKWIKKKNVRDALILQEQPDNNILMNVLKTAYGMNPPEDIALEKIGGDPFLVAYGCADKKNRVIITKEISKPKRQPQNRKIPDACDICGVKWMSDFQLYKELNFHTK